MFELLFNYPITTWQQAEWVVAREWPVVWLLLLSTAVVLFVIGSLWRMPLSIGKRFTIASFQLFAAAVALLMLWLPSLKSNSIEPGENTVAYVVDTSGSMYQTDEGESNSRITATTNAIQDAKLLASPVFNSSLYSLAEQLEPIESLSNMPPAGKRSAIVQGLESLNNVVDQQALAAVVLFSDGANNIGTPDTRWWQALKAAGTPVHTVGVGALQTTTDLELVDVSMQQSSSTDSIVRATVVIQHQNISEARLKVTSGERLLYAEDIVLSADQQQSAHQLEFNSGDEGINELEFSISSSVSEDNTINNSQRRILNVGKDKKRILYVEGEPRWEFKFIRRAMENDSNIDIVSLLRTSDNKFYRQGVSKPSELASGFPETRAELFGYDAIIVGSFEAALLTLEQQTNLRDFVNVRGGSLLMLAGNSGLADGGWGRTLVAQALPVRLSSSESNKDFQRGRIEFSITQQGLRTDWLTMSGDNVVPWNELPELADVQITGEPRAGSVVLLNARVDNKEQPLLVWQRYGQGQSFVLATSGTWRWQMRMPSTDQTHERFWQSLLTQLVSQTLQAIAIENIGASYRDTPTLPLAVTIRDTNFAPITQGRITVQVTAPDNSVTPVELTADLTKPGRFVGSVSSPEAGPYSMKVAVPPSGESQAPGVEQEAWWMVSKDTAESFGANRRDQFLKRIASETGGQYFDLSNLDELPKALSQNNAAITRANLLPLWNMPFFFLCLFAAKLFEWLLRLRWQRL